MQLRDYQEKLISDIRAEFVKGSRAVLAISPTGSGKTATTAAMIQRSVTRGFTALFTVHRQELMDQSITAFREQGIDHGCIAAGYDMDLSKPVQIASIETLRRRFSDISFMPSLMVVDEAAHACSRSWQEVINGYPESRIVGVTATGQRLDGKGLGAVFQRMVLGPTTRWLIDRGYLAEFDIFAPSHPDLSKVNSKFGDYIQNQIEPIMAASSITGDALRGYVKHCLGKRAIAFCVSVKNSIHLCEQFNLAGIPSAHIDGTTPKKERSSLVERFRNGEILVLTSVDIFSEGFDLPAVEAVLLLRPTQSLSMYLQQVGRALRPSPGKEKAIILDHAGNVRRHLFPDEPRNWTLADARKKKMSDEERDVLIRQCPKCHYTHRPATICPYCNFVYTLQPRKVEMIEGDLVKLQRIKQQKKLNMEVGMTKTREGLEKLAIDRGYKSPSVWAELKLAARENRTPNFKLAMARRVLY